MIKFGTIILHLLISIFVLRCNSSESNLGQLSSNENKVKSERQKIQESLDYLKSLESDKAFIQIQRKSMNELIANLKTKARANNFSLRELMPYVDDYSMFSTDSEGGHIKKKFEAFERSFSTEKIKSAILFGKLANVSKIFIAFTIYGSAKKGRIFSIVFAYNLNERKWTLYSVDDRLDQI
ncbi:hypothetical protein EHQ13_13835 [Leptospira gomenensis]|uniref:Uncharacterized protein n=1 Tax=Leptospira gomenensis TaxID=2484974 RepID=A0A5F1YAR2_9LEPT|nr:hypothetical protein [Leptospira gomenensis]TGK33783.1 hypothetical protein EHQ17_10310 [Leptospira gomenensis]TGK44035.1 hypothetical protein EHQ07_12515 [Leptospira gomenensis]TGK58760.1 hypothetical protein EHQ13_13835 [Leptospira gomenensis]